MNKEKVLKEITRIVEEQMPSGEVTSETHVINDLNADSLDTVEMLMWLEDEFMVSISDEEAEKILVVKDAVELVMIKIHNRGKQNEA
jgi:acyl carrier protein